MSCTTPLKRSIPCYPKKNESVYKSESRHEASSQHEAKSEDHRDLSTGAYDKNLLVGELADDCTNQNKKMEEDIKKSRPSSIVPNDSSRRCDAVELLKEYLELVGTKLKKELDSLSLITSDSEFRTRSEMTYLQYLSFFHDDIPFLKETLLEAELIETRYRELIEGKSTFSSFFEGKTRAECENFLIRFAYLLQTRLVDIFRTTSKVNFLLKALSSVVPVPSATERKSVNSQHHFYPPASMKKLMVEDANLKDLKRETLHSLRNDRKDSTDLFICDNQYKVAIQKFDKAFQNIFSSGHGLVKEAKTSVVKEVRKSVTSSNSNKDGKVVGYVHTKDDNGRTIEAIPLYEVDYEAYLTSLQKYLVSEENAVVLPDYLQEFDITFLYPGPNAEEVACFQPFSTTVLVAFGLCIGKIYEQVDKSTSQSKEEHQMGDESTSPSKEECQEDKATPQSSSSPRNNALLRNLVLPTFELLRKKRIADEALETTYVQEDDIFTFTEEKPGCQKYQSGSQLDRESESQLLSHLSKYISNPFHSFFGTDTKASGLTLSPVHLCVHRLKLQNAGKEDMFLEHSKSACVHFLKKDNFIKWCDGDEDLHDDYTNSMKMYNNTLPSEPGIDGLAFIVLCNLMTCSRKHLFGTLTSGSDGKLGELLAYGSFSSIYASADSEEKNMVYKVSRYGTNIDNLKREHDTLHKLKDVSGLIKSNGIGEIDMTIGGVKKPFRALSLSPLGMRLDFFLRTEVESSEKTAFILSIGKTLSQTLKTIHGGFKICHNDVSPNNLMVDMETKNPMLIDFDLACQIDEEQQGFWGTVQYVHRSVFEDFACKRTFTVKAENDLYGLAYSLTSIVSGGCSWKYLDPREVKVNNDKSNEDLREVEVKKRKFNSDFEEWCEERNTAVREALVQQRNIEGSSDTWQEEVSKMFGNSVVPSQSVSTT